MTDRKIPKDQYEDTLFVLLMDEMAQEDGEELLRLNEALKQDPGATVPEEIQRRCEKAIRTAFFRRQFRTTGRRTARWFSKLRLAAIVAVFLLLACACAVALGLDKRFLLYLGLADKESPLLGETAVTIDQSHTYENGWTLSLQQAMADRYSLALLFQAIPPTQAEFSPSEFQNPSHLNVTFSPSYVKEGDPTNAFFGFDYWSLSEDGMLSLITSLFPLTGTQTLLGETVSVSPLNLTYPYVDFSEALWSCKFTLSSQDPGIDYSIMRNMALADGQITLESVYISPITLALTLNADAHLELPSHTQWVDRTFLTTAAGENIYLSQIYSYSADETGHRQLCFRPEKPLDPEKIVSLTLWGQTFQLD